jgi:hypothetical protein
MGIENTTQMISRIEQKISSRISDITKLSEKFLKGSNIAMVNDIAIGRSLDQLDKETKDIYQLFQTVRNAKRNPEDNVTIIDGSHEPTTTIKESLDEAFSSLRFLDDFYKNLQSPEEKIGMLHTSTNESDMSRKDEFAEAIQASLKKISIAKEEIETLISVSDATTS